MASLADIMAAALPRGSATIPNPITGRQSENVEVVQGYQTMPQEARDEFAKAFLGGMDIGHVAGPFDTLTSRSLTAPAGALAQWRPKGAPLNPDFSGLATLAAMPSPAAPAGQPPDSSRIQPGQVGPWDPTYGAGYGRGAAFRPSYNLLLER